MLYDTAGIDEVIAPRGGANLPIYYIVAVKEIFARGPAKFFFATGRRGRTSPFGNLARLPSRSAVAAGLNYSRCLYALKMAYGRRIVNGLIAHEHRKVADRLLPRR
jgi:hypothetical protein